MKKPDLFGVIHALAAAAFIVVIVITWTLRDFAFWCFVCSILLILANSFLTSVYLQRNSVERGYLMYVPVVLTLTAVIVMTLRLPDIVDYNANKYLSAHIGVFAVSIIAQLVMLWKFDREVEREEGGAVTWNRVKSISLVVSGMLMFTMFMVIFVDLKPVRQFLWRTVNNNADMEKNTPKTPVCSLKSGTYGSPITVTFTKESEDDQIFISEGDDASRVYDDPAFYLGKRGVYRYTVYAVDASGLESMRGYYDFYIDIPEPYTASGVIHDEILSSAENGRGDWQSGYDKMIERWQQMNEGFSPGYRYIYLNDDEIPELCLFSDDGTDRAMNLYTVVDGKITYVTEFDMYGTPFIESVFTSIDRGGEEYYIEKTGILIHSGKKTGTTYYDSYSLHHKWKQAMKGDRGVINDCYEAYRLNGNRLEQIFCYIYIGDGAYEFSYKKKDAEPDYVYRNLDKELAECEELSMMETEYNFAYFDRKKVVPIGGG